MEPHLPQIVPQTPQPASREDRLAQVSDFLSQPIDEQFKFIDSLDKVKLARLHDLYFDLAATRPMLPSEYRAFERILARHEPTTHDEHAQEASIRELLKPENLAKLRADTYDSQVRPLLSQPHEWQIQWLKNLSASQLDALTVLLSRYAGEFGRSRRCVQLENLVHSIRSGLPIVVIDPID